MGETNMTQKILLDLFCCAGGAARGYQQAGFYVVGVDINPQPHYVGDEFFRGDALDFGRRYGKDFYAIHASPPCQAYSVMTKGRWQDREHPMLIPEVRRILQVSGRHYVIENVEGARRELVTPTLLCGTMFRLETSEGNQLLRHRYFETSFSLGLTQPCQHNKYSALGVYGGGQNPARKRRKTVTDGGHSGGTSKRDGITEFGVDARREVMQINWMTNSELSEAIPPAYTRWIGERIP